MILEELLSFRVTDWKSEEAFARLVVEQLDHLNRELERRGERWRVCIEAEAVTFSDLADGPI
jgi:hypothetical protein